MLRDSALDRSLIVTAAVVEENAHVEAFVTKLSRMLVEHNSGKSVAQVSETVYPHCVAYVERCEKKL